jgi:hypothetical protein
MPKKSNFIKGLYKYLSEDMTNKFDASIKFSMSENKKELFGSWLKKTETQHSFLTINFNDLSFIFAFNKGILKTFGNIVCGIAENGVEERSEPNILDEFTVDLFSKSISKYLKENHFSSISSSIENNATRLLSFADTDPVINLNAAIKIEGAIIGEVQACAEIKV